VATVVRAEELLSSSCLPNHGRVPSLNDSRHTGEKENAMEILIILVVVLVLDVAAWRWGVDSREGEARPEWKRRTLRDFGSERRT